MYFLFGNLLLLTWNILIIQCLVVLGLNEKFLGLHYLVRP